MPLNYWSSATRSGPGVMRGITMQRFQISKPGAVATLLGVLFVAIALIGGPAAAQSADNSDPPVIGGDSTTPTTAAPEQDPEVLGDDAEVLGDEVVDDDVVTEVVAVEGGEEELAFTGPVTDALGYTGVALVLIGIYLTMFGQPSVPHGRHSSPSSRLRMSMAGLAISSIATSLGSATKRRR